jgi:hypothetical protein
MLKLRRGVVVATDPLTVEVDGEPRRAWADASLVGDARTGDEVVVNTVALDLGLGSGGFDVVHVNLTRGLDASGPDGPHVMKLNYTSLQHPVQPVERPDDELGNEGTTVPVLVIPLHGHLAPAAWATSEASAGLRVGYMQTAGGALPGSMSSDVVGLRERDLLCGHVTAGPAYGGEGDAISIAGALDAAANALGWGAVIAGPGPGMLGSDTRYGHGGMAALDTAHTALALGMPTLLSPRLSASDPRPRHRGLSHHTRTVLDLLLAGVEVPVPEGAAEVVDELQQLIGDRHRAKTQPVDLQGYADSGLPASTMGRDLDDDGLFFAAPLAAGRALAEAARG